MGKNWCTIWGGLLFETPFVLGRSVVFLIPLIVVLNFYLSIKARISYNKGKNLIKD